MMRLMAIMMLGVAGLAWAGDEDFPKPDWQEQASLLASADAVPGGEIRVFAGPYPKSLNYLLDSSVLSLDVFNALYESLLDLHPLTMDFQPGLAARWRIGEDRKTFTFWLDEQARWSDGQPVTAYDVEWTVQAILDPKHLTGPHKVDLERFEAPVVVNDREIRFTAREVHWKNLLTLAGLTILPKHVMSTQDFNKINFEFPVVSGGYRIGELKEGFSCRLDRRPDAWRRERPGSAGLGNFDRITYLYYQERDNAFEALKKGTVDFYAVYTAHQWVNQTSGDRFDRNWIVKQKVRNYNPVGFQGFAMNARQPPFDDVRVRKAMALLLNREKMNRTLMYDQYFLHRSYYEDLYDPEHPCPATPLSFDKEQARALLEAAGWKVDGATGLLQKDGKAFRFNFLTRDASTDKFLVIYQEDLKDVGIQMDLVQKDWSAWMKDMDEFNYDMTWAAWGGGVWRDPEHQWSSAEAARPASQNITGFKNEKVDELITRQRTEFDIQKRNAILREIDAILVAEMPYVLLWNINYTRLLYWNKFGMPAHGLGKYGDERAAYSLWWYDEDAVADLEAAQAEDRALPRRPETIVFDDAFQR
jgi:microcin C transport system substrate-binding protein